MPQLGLRHQVGQRQVGVGPGHEVGPPAAEQLVLHALGHAAQHADDEPLSRMLAFLCP